MEWTDYSLVDQNRMQDLHIKIGQMLPPAPQIDSLTFVYELTYEQAISVIKAARRNLLDNLLAQETHEHWLDDCGEYLAASLEIFHHLFTAYYDSDGLPEATIESVSNFLRYITVTELACDGDVRFAILPEDLRDSLQALNDAIISKEAE